MTRTRAAALAVVIAALLTGCSSAVSGHGSDASGGPSTTAATGSSTRSGGAFPVPTGSDSGAGSAAPVTTPPVTTPSTSAVSSTPAPAATYRPLDVDAGGTTYAARIYASDTITDCAAHAYGTIVAFLRAHPCEPTRRVLGTVDLGGRTVVVSVISTSFTATHGNPLEVAGQFATKEKQDDTGSINDLLREQHTVPGIVAHRIPGTEAFEVLVQDNGVEIFDAWYQYSHTPDQDPPLVKLEKALFLTSYTSG